MPIFTVMISTLLLALNVAGVTMLLMRVDITIVIAVLITGLALLTSLSIINQKVRRYRKAKRLLIATS